MNIKRMLISLVVSALCGVFCAYGTSTVEIPGFEVTMPYLLTIFYNRLLMGFVIGLAGSVRILKKESFNSIIRGIVIGAIISVGISFYGGGFAFIGAGILYGALTDFLATRFGK
ncbi:hypothetical protein [[Eubacterium] cellulosolvens]